MRRRLLTLVGAAVLPLALAAPAFGHTQTVAPSGLDDPIRDGVGVSRVWAQAHCEGAAPAIVGSASNGVMSFGPAGNLACSTALNPGGQDPAAGQ